MKNQLIILAGSLSKTIIIATIVGWAGMLSGKLFWPAFIIAVVVQFIIFYIISLFLEYKSKNDARLHLFKEAALVGINTINVVCAGCKKTSDVAIRLDGENRFTCGHCNAKNAVYITAETAIVTEPLYETNPIADINSTTGN